MSAAAARARFRNGLEEDMFVLYRMLVARLGSDGPRALQQMVQSRTFMRIDALEWNLRHVACYTSDMLEDL